MQRLHDVYPKTRVSTLVSRRSLAVMQLSSSNSGFVGPLRFPQRLQDGAPFSAYLVNILTT
jgi:hypothetical protein